MDADIDMIGGKGPAGGLLEETLSSISRLKGRMSESINYLEGRRIFQRWFHSCDTAWLYSSSLVA